MKSILISSKNNGACKAISDCFRGEYDVRTVTDRASCFTLFRANRFEFIFVDVEFLCGGSLQNGYTDYKEGLKAFWQMFPASEIIVLSPQKAIREAVNAVKAGASNYLPYPIDVEELKYVTEIVYESMRIKSELDYHRDKFWQNDWMDMAHVRSPLMKKVLADAASVGPTETTVLITGETGTGKGVVARLIHRESKRRKNQFISVHCGAIPDTLLESELFGHEKGAFTGAFRKKLGKFEIARGGTIFLDEIATISAAAQIKLLQVLQDGTFQRVGGEETIEANARIIAASNMDLRKMSKEGFFRYDLYYRLDVFHVEIPSLRDRKEDIPGLLEISLKRLNKRYGKDIHDIDPSAMEALQRYSWPGNIRELENLVERAYILEESPILRAEGFPGELMAPAATIARYSPSEAHLTLEEARQKSIQSTERDYLKQVLTANAGKMKDTANAAGIGTRQLRKLLKKYGIKKESFRNGTNIARQKAELAVPLLSKGELEVPPLVQFKGKDQSYHRHAV